MKNRYRMYGTFVDVDGDESELTAFMDADTAKIAMENVRSGLYDMGCSNILFTRIQQQINEYIWEEIPMMQALELE